MADSGVFGRHKRIIMRTSRKEFFDYVALNGLENALSFFFSSENNDDNIVEFDDGTTYETVEELRNYYNEKENHMQEVIEGLRPEIFK